MNERSYIRQKPLWLAHLDIRHERAAYEARYAAERAAQTWQERCEFNRYANQANGLANGLGVLLGQGGNT